MPIRPLISPEYAALNQRLHETNAAYGAGAAKSAHGLIEHARRFQCSIILDYGCGKGTLKPAIEALAPDLQVLEFDPAIPGKETLPSQRPDLIIARDVMEHIEPDFLDGVLGTMSDLKPRVVVLSISLVPAKKSLPDGRNAHLIVEDMSWWNARLSRYFTPLTSAETPGHLLYIGVPL